AGAQPADHRRVHPPAGRAGGPARVAGNLENPDPPGLSRGLSFTGAAVVFQFLGFVASRCIIVSGVAMSLEIRCNCGWTSQVSEFYLGDRVSCPDCGQKLNVHPQSGVPYGYAPYPTWQKRPATSLP